MMICPRRSTAARFATVAVSAWFLIIALNMCLTQGVPLNCQTSVSTNGSEFLEELEELVVDNEVSICSIYKRASRTACVRGLRDCFIVRTTKYTACSRCARLR